MNNRNGYFNDFANITNWDDGVNELVEEIGKDMKRRADTEEDPMGATRAAKAFVSLAKKATEEEKKAMEYVWTCMEWDSIQLAAIRYNTTKEEFAELVTLTPKNKKL